MQLPTWRTSIYAPMIFSVVLHAALMAQFVSRQKGDLSALMFVGTRWQADPAFKAVTRNSPGDGYDGQFYYLLAQDPFHPHAGRLDHPVRHMRIAYPLLCWLLSGFGNARALIVIMPLVNLACVGGITFLAARYARIQQQSPWWGMLLPLVLNVLAPSLRNLTDPLAMLSAFALLIAWQKRVPWQIVFWSTITVFAREQNAVVLGIIGVLAIHQRLYRIAMSLFCICILYAIWMMILRDMYGTWTNAPPGGNFAGPFVGIEHWWNWKSYHRTMATLRAIYGIFLLIQIGLLLMHAIRGPHRGAELWLGFAGTMLLILAGPLIWDDWWAYTRSFFWLPMAIWILNIRNASRIGLIASCISVVFLYATVKVL